MTQNVRLQNLRDFTVQIRNDADQIVGTGIETSFDVQFTVRLLKGKKITWPRGENADYVFAIGNARPLDQADDLAASAARGVDHGRRLGGRAARGHEDDDVPAAGEALLAREVGW